MKLGGGAVVDGGGGHQPDPGVAVRVVVPAEELAENARACSIETNRSGNPGRVFQRLELRFGVRVISRGVRPGVGLGDAEKCSSASLNTWILTVYAPLVGIAAASELTGKAPRTGGWRLWARASSGLLSRPTQPR